MDDGTIRQLFLSIMDTNENGMLITKFAEEVKVQLHINLLKLATDRGYYEMASYLRSFPELRVDASNFVQLREKSAVTAHVRDLISEQRKSTKTRGKSRGASISKYGRGAVTRSSSFRRSTPSATRSGAVYSPPSLSNRYPTHRSALASSSGTKRVTFAPPPISTSPRLNNTRAPRFVRPIVPPDEVMVSDSKGSVVSSPPKPSRAAAHDNLPERSVESNEVAPKPDYASSAVDEKPNRPKISYVPPAARYACVNTSDAVLKAEIGEPREPAKVTRFLDTFDWSKVGNKKAMFCVSSIASCFWKLHNSKFQPYVCMPATRDPDPEPDAFSAPGMQQRESEPRIREQREFEVHQRELDPEVVQHSEPDSYVMEQRQFGLKNVQDRRQNQEVSQQRQFGLQRELVPEVVQQREFGLKVSQHHEPDKDVVLQRQFGLKVLPQCEPGQKVGEQRQFGLKNLQKRKEVLEVAQQREFGLKSAQVSEPVREVVQHREPVPAVVQHREPNPPADFPTISTTETVPRRGYIASRYQVSNDNPHGPYRLPEDSTRWPQSAARPKAEVQAEEEKPQPVFVTPSFNVRRMIGGRMYVASNTAPKPAEQLLVDAKEKREKNEDRSFLSDRSRESSSSVSLVRYNSSTNSLCSRPTIKKDFKMSIANYIQRAPKPRSESPTPRAPTVQPLTSEVKPLVVSSAQDETNRQKMPTSRVWSANDDARIENLLDEFHAAEKQPENQCIEAHVDRMRDEEEAGVYDAEDEEEGDFSNMLDDVHEPKYPISAPIITDEVIDRLVAEFAVLNIDDEDTSFA